LKQQHIVAACLGAALLASCGGSDSNVLSQSPQLGGAANSQSQRIHHVANSTLDVVYVANNGSHNVSAYTINNLTGALVKVQGSPFAASDLPVAVAVDSVHKFAYVVNQHYPQKHGNIFAYTIDASTGALTVVGKPYLTGASPYAISIANSFVYVPDIFSDNVAGYSIQSTGALKTIGTYGPDAQPEGITVDPSDSFAFVTNSESNTVSPYAINPSSGALTPVYSSGSYGYSTGTTPEKPAVDPSGTYLYVPNTNSNNISVYKIGYASGELTEVSGSPFSAGTNPYDVAIDPKGIFAFVTNAGGSDVSVYKINPSTGALTEVSGSPFAAGSDPLALAVAPLGTYLYVANFGSSNISVYRINRKTGALRQVLGSPFAAGTNPQGIAIGKL
jgi:6-phosphogluconolactonase